MVQKNDIGHIEGLRNRLLSQKGFYQVVHATFALRYVCLSSEGRLRDGFAPSWNCFLALTKFFFQPPQVWMDVEILNWILVICSRYLAFHNFVGQTSNQHNHTLFQELQPTYEKADDFDYIIIVSRTHDARSNLNDLFKIYWLAQLIKITLYCL